MGLNERRSERSYWLPGRPLLTLHNDGQIQAAILTGQGTLSRWLLLFTPVKVVIQVGGDKSGDILLHIVLIKFIQKANLPPLSQRSIKPFYSSQACLTAGQY